MRGSRRRASVFYRRSSFSKKKRLLQTEKHLHIFEVKSGKCESAPTSDRSHIAGLTLGKSESALLDFLKFRFHSLSWYTMPNLYYKICNTNLREKLLFKLFGRQSWTGNLDDKHRKTPTAFEASKLIWKYSIGGLVRSHCKARCPVHQRPFSLLMKILIKK